MNSLSLQAIFVFVIFTLIQCSNAAIWRPKPGTTWNWSLYRLPTKEEIDRADYQAIDVPLYSASSEIINYMHKRNLKVICYFSVGTCDKKTNNEMKSCDVMKNANSKLVRDSMEEWDERWLDYRQSTVKQFMLANLKLAYQKRCDAVELDNIDAFTNTKWEDNPLTPEDQIKYVRWLASEAHKLGLSVGLKNGMSIINRLVDIADFTINESCFKYKECYYYDDVLEKYNKAVFTAFYGSPNDSEFIKEVCNNVDEDKKLSIIIKDANRLLDYPYTRFEYSKFCPNSHGNSKPKTTTTTTVKTTIRTTIKTTVKPTTTKRRTTVKPTTTKRRTTVKPVTTKQRTTVKPVTTKRRTTIKPVTTKRRTTVKPVTTKQRTTVKPVTTKRKTTIKPKTKSKKTRVITKIRTIYKTRKTRITHRHPSTKTIKTPNTHNRNRFRDFINFINMMNRMRHHNTN